MLFSCKYLILQDNSIIFITQKQEKNERKTNYFIQLNKQHFLRIHQTCGLNFNHLLNYLAKTEGRQTFSAGGRAILLGVPRLYTSNDNRSFDGDRCSPTP
jgi:hypothetical protein